MRSPPAAPVSAADYAVLADFRFMLRRFLQFSAEAARSAGLSPQQHQALLAIKGLAGRERISVGRLAAQLHVRHHSAVGLVDRLGRRKLVRRLPDPEDRRRVEVRLTAAGEALIGRLSAAHKRELQSLGPELRRLLDSLDQRE
jgi:DNA-binding MarR family transcriptional regulator